MTRIVVRMDGWAGAPGFMTFYSGAAGVLKAATDAFIGGVAPAFPSSVTFTVPAEGDLVLDSDGTLAGSWTSGSATTIPGGGDTLFAAPSGACVSWTTGDIVTGSAGRPRRLRGRTFLVPLAHNLYASDGTIDAASLTNLRNRASTFWVDGSLVVWHRPTTVGGTDGFAGDVIGSDVKDKVAVLRSRRG